MATGEPAHPASAGTLGHYESRAEAFREGTRDHDVSQNHAALLRAIEWNEVVTIDDAAHDDAVACYMTGHIKNKNIQSVAIVPIGRGEVRWLIVLDKVPPSRKGFSSRDREHLESNAISTSGLFRRASPGKTKRDALTIYRFL